MKKLENVTTIKERIERQERIMAKFPNDTTIQKNCKNNIRILSKRLKKLTS